LHHNGHIFEDVLNLREEGEAKRSGAIDDFSFHFERGEFYEVDQLLALLFDATAGVLLVDELDIVLDVGHVVHACYALVEVLHARLELIDLRLQLILLCHFL
jgi:hypothetical protein